MAGHEKNHEDQAVMSRRVLRIEIFLGSTTEEVNRSLSKFLSQNICVGNYVDTKLYKLGSVYQLVLAYTEVVEHKQGEEHGKVGGTTEQDHSHR